MIDVGATNLIDQVSVDGACPLPSGTVDGQAGFPSLVSNDQEVC